MLKTASHVFLALLWFFVPAQGRAADVAVKIELASMSLTPAPREAVLSFYRTGETPESAIRIVVADDRRVLELPEGSWEVAVSAEGYWSPPQIWNITESRDGATYPVPLWPVGFVTGKLGRDTPTAPFPGELRLRFEPVEPLRDPELPRSEVACPVEPETGAFRCALPVGHLFVSLRRPGYVPIYRPGLRLGRTMEFDFGKVTFQPGASLVGWVALDGARLEAGKGFAALRPAGGAENDPTGERKLAAAEVVATIATDGFLQFTGLAPGIYDLVVQYPEFAPLNRSRIAISARQELVLAEPLLLRKPVDLVVLVEPPTDFYGKPWKLMASLRNQEKREPLQGETDELGLWRAANSSPGRYHFLVESSDGNRFASLEQEVTDAPSAQVTIKVEAVALRGRLTLGDDPVAAELVFGTRFGSLRSTLVSDADGNFQGLLPRSGPWAIEIHSASPDLSVLKAIEAETEPDEDGFVVVDIRLPDNRVFGSVQDENGQPLAKARVNLDSWTGPVRPTTQSDDQGRFALRALDAGTAVLSAEKRSFGESWEAPGQVLQVPEEGALGPVVFRLQRSRRVRGTVTGPNGPLTGTTVRLSPLDPHYASTAPEVLTGPDGTFEVRFPAGTNRAAVSLEPPGYFFDVLRAEVSAELLVLPVATAGGTLAIEFAVGEADLQPIVLRNGLPVALGVLQRWATHGRSQIPENSVRVPRVATGDWALCGLPRAAFPALMSNPEALSQLGTLARCVSGDLPPGGELTLRFESAPEVEGDLRDSPAPRHNPRP
jgi:Carboxypeptidase regulatory-like domain